MPGIEPEEYARQWLAEYLVKNGVDAAVATARVAKHVTEFTRTIDGKQLMIKSGDRFFPAPVEGQTSSYWDEFAKILLKTAPRRMDAGAEISMEELIDRKRATGRYAM
ncbi:MAG: hypothetical protein H0T48_13785 [Gemmatimonadaceae bacterium]|nr:hypothetical protein [Gemmatimonadaceae bacterium]